MDVQRVVLNLSMKTMMRVPYTLFLLACFAFTPTARAGEKTIPPSKAGRPLLVHLNGVGGRRTIDDSLVVGLRDAGFDGRLTIHDWTGGKIGIEALQGKERHKAESQKLANFLIKYATENPQAPIHITAHSGGAGIAVWALELLPENVRVESLFLIAPALSPEYDLTKALKHVTKNLYVFSSPHDTIILAAGCKVFGTIDGVKCEAAGVNGFVQPETADAEQYKKLVHYPYRKTWLKTYGNAGSHICAMRYRFAKEYIGPIFLTGVAPEDKADEPAAAGEPAAAP